MLEIQYPVNKYLQKEADTWLVVMLMRLKDEIDINGNLKTCNSTGV